MGLCDNPDKIIKKRFRKRKTSYSTGKNPGSRHRGLPKMEEKPIDWIRALPITGNSVVVTIPGPSTLIETSKETHEMWDTHGYIQNWYNPLVRENYFVGSLEVPNIIEEYIDESGGSEDVVQHVLVDFQTTRPAFRQVIRETLPFLSNDDIEELVLRSHDKLDKVVDTEVSIANFIIELIEVLEGNVRGIKRFRDIYEKCLKEYQKAYRRFLSQGHKESAARWLAWNFAIKPFIKDLRAILCSISNAYRKMKWLQDHNNKVCYKDYIRKDLGDLLDYDPNEYRNGALIASVLCHTHPASPVNGGYGIQVRYTDVKIVYHARSKFFLSIPDEYLKGAFGMSVLWGAMQGLHNPIGIVWEAIPFSWLIDYFLSYRARLWQSLYDYNPYNKGVENLGYGHSFTIKAEGDARVQNILKDTTHFSYGKFMYDIHFRQAGLPEYENASLFRLPGSWYQASIIGAIGIGLLPRRR